MKKISKVAMKFFSELRPNAKILVDYDTSEDVLYVNYLNSSPQKADFGRRFGDYIIRLKKGVVVGVTILNAKEHLNQDFKDLPRIASTRSDIVVCA